jgi:hypothetical protein
MREAGCKAKIFDYELDSGEYASKICNVRKNAVISTEQNRSVDAVSLKVEGANSAICFAF